ncbi:hypothetical protein VTL71DRAFT_11942 [Oculimacula yallundae]|uniref:Ribosome maturation protein SDO1/SBDS N-terminal domain-containing protein n=1 Tax=Oculimacula yallundae TaxID=86028 RepID=A0ABR4CRU8_9HELO
MYYTTRDGTSLSNACLTFSKLQNHIPPLLLCFLLFIQTPLIQTKHHASTTTTFEISTLISSRYNKHNTSIQSNPTQLNLNQQSWFAEKHPSPSATTRAALKISSSSSTTLRPPRAGRPTRASLSPRLSALSRSSLQSTQGKQGVLDAASNQTLETEFGTSNEEEVIKQILEKGEMQHTEGSARQGPKNDSMGARAAH